MSSQRLLKVHRDVPRGSQKLPEDPRGSQASTRPTPSSLASLPGPFWAPPVAFLGILGAVSNGLGRHSALLGHLGTPLEAICSLGRLLGAPRGS